MHAVDISPEVVHVAERGVYSPELSEMVSASIFDALTEAERGEMFHWERDKGTIKPWLRDGVTWQVGDAGDPNLIRAWGPRIWWSLTTSSATWRRVTLSSACAIWPSW